MLDLLFYLAFAGLLSHELDAVHKHEWRLLFVLRNMPDEQARDAFILIHVPALVLLLWLLNHSDIAVRTPAMLALDGFMVIHAGLHWRLSSNPKYEFNAPISRLLIFGTAVIALIHLALSLF
jgi:hypothetical protein